MPWLIWGDMVDMVATGAEEVLEEPADEPAEADPAPPADEDEPVYVVPSGVVVTHVVARSSYMAFHS